MLLSVLIPAFNEERYLPQTLTEIQRALEVTIPDRSQWEIVVCDNNSTDRTAAIAYQYGALVIHEPINQISRARNSAACAANGEWLLFMDADTHPDPELMHEVVRSMEKFPMVGFGSTIKVVQGSWFNRLRLERLNLLYRIFKLSGGAFIGCRRSAFQSIGGFGEELYAIEELDFLLRLKKFGNSRGMHFQVFFKNPVHTSGRKGEFAWKSMVRLVFSNVLAIFLYLLRGFLPKRWIRFMGQRWLTYWYSGQR